jgi:hypothetical protein
MEDPKDKTSKIALDLSKYHPKKNAHTMSRDELITEYLLVYEANRVISDRLALAEKTIEEMKKHQIIRTGKRVKIRVEGGDNNKETNCDDSTLSPFR